MNANDLDVKNRVQVFRFEIQYHSEAKAYSFQQELIEFIKEEILPACDSILTEISGEKYYRIQKLELDLGDFYESSFNDDFRNRLIDLLTQKLLQLISGSRLDDDGNVVEELDLKDNLWEGLEYFLEYGFLPWNYQSANEFISVQELILNLTTESPKRLKKILERKAHDELVMKRIIRQFDDEVIFKIISIWESDIQFLENIKRVYHEITLIYHRKKFIRHESVEFRELVFEIILKEILLYNKKNLSAGEWIKVILVQFSKHDGLDEYKIKSHMANVLLSGKNKSGKPRQEIYSKEFSGLSKEWFEYLEDGKSQSIDDGSITAERLTETRMADPEIIDSVVSNKEKINFIQRKEGQLARYFVLSNGISYQEFKNYSLQIESLLRELAALEDFNIKRILETSGIILNSFSWFRTIDSLSLPSQQILLSGLQLTFQEYEFARQKFLKEFVHQVKISGFVEAVSKLNGGQFPLDLEYLLFLFENYKNDQVLFEVREWKDENFQVWKSLLPFQLKNKVDGLIVDANKSENLKNSNRNNPSFKSINITEVRESEPAFLILSQFIETGKMPGGLSFKKEDLIILIIENYQTQLQEYVLLLDKTRQDLIMPHIPDKIRSQITEIIIERNEKIETARRNLNNPEVQIQNNNAPFADEIRTSSDIPDKKDRSKSEDPSYEFKKIPEGEPIYIVNSGLVVFHPYLQRFFKLTDLLNKRSFKDEFSAHKAAHLLQYLVNKSEFPEEHEMVLNKIICGINPEMPLMKGIRISEEEKELCEELINGVIQNWTILKKTSNDNFRSSFLIREGRLLYEPQGWRLRVEERGYDILVEKIPWSISTVMLPWMKKPVFVEWK